MVQERLLERHKSLIEGGHVHTGSSASLLSTETIRKGLAIVLVSKWCESRVVKVHASPG